MSKLLTSAAVYTVVTGWLVVYNRLVKPVEQTQTTIEKRFESQSELLEKIEKNTRRTADDMGNVSTAIVLKLSERGTALLQEIAAKR